MSVRTTSSTLGFSGTNSTACPYCCELRP
uniref:Uncharacterized protein n=1 Tax=Rhizophora mucronata TaxID=61149 RepID=A0A2P2N8E9_RHIMU